VTDVSLQRIEAALEKLVARQSEILARIDRLEGRGEAPAAASPRERTIAFLDQFRAGEALGEMSLGAWIAVCRDAELRGGLRVVQTREGSHARLLTERIKELGGAPRYEIPEATYEQVMAGSASTASSDAEKVEAFVSRFPDPARALAPIRAIADQLRDDPETRSLLCAVAEGERTTLEFFYAARERMEER
jgi:hypothetical protein